MYTDLSVICKGTLTVLHLLICTAVVCERVRLTMGENGNILLLLFLYVQCNFSLIGDFRKVFGKLNHNILRYCWFSYYLFNSPVTSLRNYFRCALTFPFRATAFYCLSQRRTWFWHSKFLFYAK